eukprot:g2925.t1
MIVGVAGIPGGHWSGTLQPTKGKSGRDAQVYFLTLPSAYTDPSCPN